MTAHVLTGATGLLGAALTLELLQRTDAELICLTRPGRAGAAARLTDTLRTAARSYGHADTLDTQIDKRCRAVAADLAEPLCGVVPARLPGRIENFWHCAADLRYEDHHWESLWRTNVEGTDNALALAEALVCRTFTYISTAYVAGKRTGVLLEEPADPRQTNNRYEDSKIMAERLVAKSAMTTRILRPSIIIGHSRTHAVIGGHSGLYGLQRRVANLRKMLSRLGTPEDLTRPLRVRVEPETPINVVPVDLVATDAVAISQSGTSATVFHLTHPRPMLLGPGFSRMFELAGLPAPLFTGDTHGFTEIDHQFDRKIVFFRSYMSGVKIFDQTTLRENVPDSRLYGWDFQMSSLEQFYLWYFKHLERRDAPVPG